MDFVSGGAVVRIEASAIESGQTIRAPFDEHVASGSSELILDTPVTGSLAVSRTQLSLHLRGMVSTLATMTCSRCLTVIRRPLEATLDEEFPLDPAAEGADVASGLSGGSDPFLDVSEVIRQSLLLAAPMAPLCGPDCRGLCPVCGVNRNEVDCGHEGRLADPRWAPLAGLKIEEKK